MFTIKVAQEQAEAEVQKLLDVKKVFPKRREALQPAIEAVVEAVMYGLVTINEDGSIEQELYTPIGETSSIRYAARVDPLTINKNIAGLKVDNQTARNLVYLKSYSGQLETIFNKMEPADRNIADSIAFFFQ